MTSRQREEESVGIPIQSTRKVPVRIEQSISVDMVPGSAVIRNVIIQAREGTSWVETDEIQVGGIFRVIVDFYAKNSACPSYGACYWAAAVTVASLGVSSVRNWNYVTSIGNLVSGHTIDKSNLVLDAMGNNTMPDVDFLILRIKLWGNADSTPSGPPPESEWTQL